MRWANWASLSIVTGNEFMAGKINLGLARGN